MFSFFRQKSPDSGNLRDEGQGVYRVRVRTDQHGDIVELRFTKAAHIGLDDDGSYVYRKAILSSGHLDRGEVTVRFDKKYRLLATEVTGGKFVPVREWDDPAQAR